jgi:hypothetical protein
VNDYIDNFTAYVLHVSITSELHQVHPFIDGLQDTLGKTIIKHLPWDIEMAIDLTRQHEHPAPNSVNTLPTTINAKQATLDLDIYADHDIYKDHMAEPEVDNPSSNMEGDSAQPSTTAAPTHQNTLGTSLLLCTSYNIGETTHPRKMDPNLTTPSTAAMINHYTLTRAPAPLASYNTGAALYIDNTPDQAILA